MRHEKKKPNGVGFVAALAALLLVPSVVGADLLERQNLFFDTIQPTYGRFERGVAVTIDGVLSVTRSMAVLGVDGVETVLGIFSDGTEEVIRDVSRTTHGYAKIVDTTESHIHSGYARVAGSFAEAGNEIVQARNEVEQAFTFPSFSGRHVEIAVALSVESISENTGEKITDVVAGGALAVVSGAKRVRASYDVFSNGVNSTITSGYGHASEALAKFAFVNPYPLVARLAQNQKIEAAKEDTGIITKTQVADKRAVSSEKILAQGKHITDGYITLADSITRSASTLSETAVASVGDSYDVADGAMDILSGGVASASESFSGIADWTRERLRTWLGIGDAGLVETPTPTPAVPAVVTPASPPTTTIVERLTERVISSGGGVSTSQIDTAIGVAIDGLRAELMPEIYRAMRSPNNRSSSSGSSGGNTTTIVSGDFLELSGGTLTGALSGTDAIFSGGLSAGTLAVVGSTTLSGVEYLFPGADGASGEFLSTDGAGGLTWVAAAGGIASLNGQADAVQTFATSSDTNIGLSISSAGGIHTFTTAWNGFLSVLRGGTGTSTAPSYGQVLVGDGSGGYTLTATSSLGITQDLSGYLTLANWYATTTDGLGQGSTNLYNQTHTGEVTGATSLTVADDVIDEANLKIAGSPTNNYLLQASSTASGGLAWVATSTLGFVDTNEWTDGGAFDYDLENVYVGTSTAVVNSPLLAVGTSSPLFTVENATGNVTVQNSIVSATGRFIRSGGYGGEGLFIGNFSTSIDGGAGQNNLRLLLASDASVANQSGVVTNANTAFMGSTDGTITGAFQALYIYGVRNSNVGGTGANLYVGGGVSTAATDGNGGDLYLRGGAKDGSGVNGNIYLGTQNTTKAYLGSTNQLVIDNTSGNVGVGTTSPQSKLTVAGEIRGANFVATSTATTTIPTLSVTGLLYDGVGTGGTNGMVLQSTGTGIAWVATSTLGLGGAGSSEWTDGGTFDYDLEEVYVGTSTTIVNRPLFAVGTSSTFFSVASTTGDVDVLNNVQIGNGKAIYFGGTSSSFPKWTNSGTELRALRADDGAYINVHAGTFIGTSGFATDAWYGGGTSFADSETALGSTGVALGSAATIGWRSVTNVIGTSDIGLARSSAGVLSVTDGSTGSGALTVGGAITFGSATDGGASPAFLKSNASKQRGIYGTTQPAFYYDGNSGDSVVNASFSGSAAIFKVSDVEKARLANNGNFGIATTAPYMKLSVAGDTILDGNLIRFASTSASTLRIDYSVAATSTIANNALYAWTLATSTTASPIMWIDTRSTGAKATTTFEGGFSVNSGAILYDYGSNVTSIENLNLGNMRFDDNAGVISWVNLPITAGPAAGTPESFSAQIDDSSVLTVYGESNGSGGVQNTRVGVGTTTPWRTFSASGTVAFNGLTTSSGTPDALCLQPGGEVTVNTGAQTCTVSSLRFKHDVREIDIGLNTITQLKPSSFVYNSATGTPRVGLIAEEVAVVDPRLVFFEAGGTTPRGVRYEDIVAVLVKAVQELNVKVDAALAAAGAGVSDLVATFTEVIADRMTTKELCLDDVCITKTELQQLLDNADVQDSSDGASTGTTTWTGDSTGTTTDTGVGEAATNTDDGTGATTQEIPPETASSTGETLPPAEEPPSPTETEPTPPLETPPSEPIL